MWTPYTSTIPRVTIPNIEYQPLLLPIFPIFGGRLEDTVLVILPHAFVIHGKPRHIPPNLVFRIVCGIGHDAAPRASLDIQTIRFTRRTQTNPPFLPSKSIGTHRPAQTFLQPHFFHGGIIQQELCGGFVHHHVRPRAIQLFLHVCIGTLVLAVFFRQIKGCDASPRVVISLHPSPRFAILGQRHPDLHLHTLHLGIVVFLDTPSWQKFAEKCLIVTPAHVIHEIHATLGGYRGGGEG
mmetsp:Transcript_35631/g.35838  ORF Transcript_35631/g.35838 Transcript_35631/m.35838 type:complete len:238 (-) Transcript_35631:80-793(-)